MSIKRQIIKEIELKKRMRGDDKISLKDISRRTNISYSGLRYWLEDDGRSMGDDKLDKIVGVLGKRFILVDKDV